MPLPPRLGGARADQTRPHHAHSVRLNQGLGLAWLGLVAVTATAWCWTYAELKGPRSQCLSVSAGGAPLRASIDIITTTTATSSLPHGRARFDGDVFFQQPQRHISIQRPLPRDVDLELQHAHTVQLGAETTPDPDLHRPSRESTSRRSGPSIATPTREGEHGGMTSAMERERG